LDFKTNPVELPEIMKIKFYAGRIRMNVLRVLALMTACLLPSVGQAQALFYETFPGAYTEGELLGGTSTGGTWNSGNGTGSSSAKIRQFAAMSYPSLVTEPTNAPSRGLQSGVGATKNRSATFATQPGTNGSVYVSFLFKLMTNNPTSPRLFASLSSSLGTGPTVDAGLFLDTSDHLLIGKNPSISSLTLPVSANTFSLSPSNTYLIVMRYKYNAGANTNDEVALWVNPTFLGTTTVPAPNVVVTNGSDTSTSMAGFSYLSPSAGLNVPVNFFMDEIRVGTNWADVTPTNSIAGSIYNVSGGGTGCPGDSFPVNLSGSQNNVSYLLYTNGVYSGLNSNGTGSAISFNSQSNTATYTVLASNTVSLGVSWMNSNAVITVFDPPVITSQPASVLCGSNSTVVYSVTASGSGLNYRWFRNGSVLSNGGHVAGATTALLTISPVAVADAATTVNGYYCVITNQCGFQAISTTNALTIQTASNLVWQGANPTNAWDLGSSANWTNTAGSAVVFNSGDNVTFDDTFQNSVVNVSGP
jgi:hypothetical protein